MAENRGSLKNVEIENVKTGKDEIHSGCIKHTHKRYVHKNSRESVRRPPYLLLLKPSSNLNFAVQAPAEAETENDSPMKSKTPVQCSNSSRGWQNIPSPPLTTPQAIVVFLKPDRKSPHQTCGQARQPLHSTATGNYKARTLNNVYYP
jgi:hypothetical protein